MYINRVQALTLYCEPNFSEASGTIDPRLIPSHRHCRSSELCALGKVAPGCCGSASETTVELMQPIKQPRRLVTQAPGGRYSLCQIAGLINAPIICSINRRASLCFVFYVSAFTAAITIGGLYFMAVWPPNFPHLYCVALSPSLTFSLAQLHFDRE